MKDFGTIITDARGVAHNLLKNSFDAINSGSSKPLSIYDKDLQTSLKQNFDNFKDALQNKLGIDPEKGLSLESIGEQIKNQFIETGTRLGTEAIVGMGLQYAGDLEGPLGVLLSEGLSIIAGEVAFLKLHQQDYLPGQWVFLDCGIKRKLVNTIPKIIQLNEVQDMFSGMMIPDVPDELDYVQTEARHAIGFILEKQANQYEYQVFSYLTGKQETIHKDKLRPCPEAFAQKLDDDEDFSKLREIFFMKAHDPTLESYIPTEPGETVIYRDEPYTIVDFSEDGYYIVNGKGETVYCGAGDLKAGRTTTNSTWDPKNYKMGGYNKTTNIFSGQWVWIKAGDFISELIHRRQRRLAAVPEALKKLNSNSRILAMVKSVEGKTVHLVRGYDGSEVDEDIHEIDSVSADVAKVLDSEVSQWKMKELRGEDVSNTITPGQAEPMLSLGLGSLTEETETRVPTPVELKSSIVQTGEAYKSDVLKQKEVEIQDELNNIDFGDERYTVKVSEDSVSDSSVSSYGTLLLIVGIAAAYNFLT